MDIDEWDGAKKVEIKKIQSLMMHKIVALQIISQNVHKNYISMQGAEFQCFEVLSLLSPLFKTWGPYIHFFDSLVPLLPQRKEFSKGVIINVRKMINMVKELNRIFSSKMQLIQGKMKIIATGIPNFIPTILDVNGVIKE